MKESPEELAKQCAGTKRGVCCHVHESLPYEMIEASRIDGCTALQAFFHIVLPLSRPICAVIAIFAINASWSDFLLPHLVLRGTPLQIQRLPLKSLEIVWHLLQVLDLQIILRELIAETPRSVQAVAPVQKEHYKVRDGFSSSTKMSPKLCAKFRKIKVRFWGLCALAGGALAAVVPAGVTGILRPSAASFSTSIWMYGIWPGIFCAWVKKFRVLQNIPYFC